MTTNKNRGTSSPYIRISGQLERSDRDLDRFFGEITREALDFFGPSGTPQQRLTIRTNLADDGTNLRLKAHILQKTPKH